MTTCTSTTFEVSSVPRATQPLSEVPYRQAISRLMAQTHKTPFTRPRKGEHARIDRGRLVEIEACETSSIEACSGDGHLVSVAAHPFLASTEHAFAEHRPLCLSPDMIWLLICQGVANHINANAEALRGYFVQQEGKLTIDVRRDDLVKGSPHNAWDKVIHALSLEVRQHIGQAHDLFMPRFSTTGVTERIAAEVVLLDAMQSFFHFHVRTMCGIPAITLEGTEEDWRDLADRARAFAEFDLEWWLEPLQRILQEFTAAARGDARPAFWESIYKYRSISGGSVITGWITAFFPYLRDQDGDCTITNPWLENGGADLDLVLAGEWVPASIGGVPTASFPLGLGRVPFEWTYFEERLAMELLGGFVGVAQDPATLTLRPEIGWAVRRKTAGGGPS